MKQTFPDYLLRWAREHGNEVALRRKHYGVWEELTWSEYLERVKTVFYGLEALFGDVDHLVMMTAPRTEYLVTALAIQSMHGVPMFTFPGNWNLDELEGIFGTIEPDVYVFEDQEQFDKYRQIRENVPEPEGLVILEHYEVRDYEESLTSYREVMERGREARERADGRFEDAVADLRPDDNAMFNRTSGTTGTPKIIQLRHRDFLERAEQFLERYPLEPGADFFSFLPTGWIGEQLVSLGLGFGARGVVNFPEDDDPEVVQRDLREISPTVLFAGPDLWESFLADVQTDLMNSTRLKQWVGERFLELGKQWTETRPEDLPTRDRLLRRVGDFLVYRHLRDHLGLAETEYAFTGGATLGPDAIREFRSFGVNFLQVYGQSEMAGLTATQIDWSNDIRSVGYPVEGLDFRISEKGEVLIGTDSGERPFPGYFENPEANEGLFTDDGYFKTEDYGHFNDDGELVMVDRLDHLIELEDGSTFSPRFVEDALRYSPFISEAFVIGDGREYITCIVEIDWEHMSWWAEENGIPFTTFADLTKREAVREVVAEEIARVNEDQPDNGRIRKFMLFDQMLDHEDQELTQTLKLRRGYLQDQYADWIAAMYGQGETDQPVVDVEPPESKAPAD